MPKYAYRGNNKFIAAVEKRLGEGGFEREGEVEVADFIITYCTNMTELEDLYFGDSGIIDRAKPKTVVVDLSPSTPNLALEINAVVTLSDMQFVDAPLFVKNQVSDCAFEKSNIGCFAASEEGSLENVSALLDILFGDIRKLAGIGVVQLAKASNTLQKVAEMVSAIESYALLASSRKSVSSAETGDFHIEATSPEAYFVLQAVEQKRFDGPFNVEMLMGELSAVIMAADDFETIIPQAEAAFHLLELLAVIGGADKSPAALALVYGDQNEQRCKEFGLDWSRAEALYEDGSRDDSDFASRGMDELFEDDIFDDDGDYPGFNYSSN